MSPPYDTKGCHAVWGWGGSKICLKECHVLFWIAPQHICHRWAVNDERKKERDAFDLDVFFAIFRNGFYRGKYSGRSVKFFALSSFQSPYFLPQLWFTLPPPWLKSLKYDDIAYLGSKFGIVEVVIKNYFTILFFHEKNLLCQGSISFPKRAY